MSKKQAHLIFGTIFRTCSINFGGQGGLRKQIILFSLSVLLSFCLVIPQFQYGVTYKRIVYKKACRYLVLCTPPAENINIIYQR